MVFIGERGWWGCVCFVERVGVDGRKGGDGWVREGWDGWVWERGGEVGGKVVGLVGEVDVWEYKGEGGEGEEIVGVDVGVWEVEVGGDIVNDSCCWIVSNNGSEIRWCVFKDS